MEEVKNAIHFTVEEKRNQDGTILVLKDRNGKVCYTKADYGPWKKVTGGVK